jgi:hypothetical protein
MLHANELRAAAKALAGGRELSAEELARVNEQAKAEWEAMDDAGRAAAFQRYQDWRIQPAPAPVARETRPVYRSAWGCGTRAAMIAPVELCSYIKQCGWPKDEEIYNSSNMRVQSEGGLVRFDVSADFNLWGCTRKPRNICDDAFRDSRLAGFVDTGLANYIDRQGKVLAESGELMVIFEGAGQASAQRAAEVFRVVAFLVGTSFNPRVSDWAVCQFCDEAASTRVPMALPFDLQLDEAVCRVTETELLPNIITSSELVYMLIDTYNFETVELFTTNYDIIDREDGGLNFYRVHGAISAGYVLVPGMQGPAIAGVPRAPRTQVLRQGNPLQARARGRGRGGGRRGGPGRRGGGRGLADEDGGQDDGGDDAAVVAPVLVHRDEVLDQSDVSDVLSDDAIDELNNQDEELALREVDDGADAQAAEEVVGVAEHAAAGVGLEDSDRPEAGALPAARPRVRPEDLVLYPSGRIYEFGLRQIGTIVRGKPRDSLSVSCNQHSKCTFVCSLRVAPSDEELKQWFVAVPRNQPEDSAGDRMRKQREHLALASQWKMGGKGKGAPPLPPPAFPPPALPALEGGAQSSSGL